MSTRLVTLACCLSIEALLSPNGALASNELVERFYAEAPSGWQRIERNLQEVEGKAIQRTTVNSSERGRETAVDRWEFKRKGDWWRFEQTFGREGRTAEAIHAKAYAVNSEYAFRIHRLAESSPWLIGGVAKTPGALSTVESGLAPIKNTLESPWRVAMLYAMPDVIKMPGFNVRSAHKKDHEGTECIAISCAWAAEVDVLVEGQLASKKQDFSGTILFDRKHDWCIAHYTLAMPSEMGPQRINVEMQCNIRYADGEGGHLPEFVDFVTDYKDRGTSHYAVEFTDLNLDASLTESDFTLTAYGLPEPEITREHRPRSLLASVAVAASAVLVLAIGIRLAMARNAKAK